jgi:hypothetical protein
MSRPLLWKALLGLSVGVNVALGVFIVWHARDADETPVAGADDSVPCLLATLGLDPAQRTAVDRVRAEFDAVHDARHTELHALRERLFRAIEASNGDRTEVDAVLEQLGAAQLGMRRGVVDQVLGIAQVLRPEQRARFLAGLRRRFVDGGHHREQEAAEESCAASSGAGTEGTSR